MTYQQVRAGEPDEQGARVLYIDDEQGAREIGTTSAGNFRPSPATLPPLGPGALRAIASILDDDEYGVASGPSTDVPTEVVDHDGYPTDRAIACIRNWPIENLGVLYEQVVCPIFESRYGQCRIEQTPGHVRVTLITGGWSGNEEVIGTLQQNPGWGLSWERSERGGLHVLRVAHWLWGASKAGEAA